MSLSLGMLFKSLCAKKLVAVLAILVCLACLPAAFGQIAAEPAGSDQAIQPPQDFTPQELWHDALHYFKIGRFSYGKAYLQAFLNAKANPSVALELSEKEPRDVQILTKLTTNPDLQEVVTKALELIDTGWELRRRDPSYVSKELDRLDRGARARFHAVDRLKQSGEYAVPVMVRYLQDPARQALYAQIAESLFALGKAGVAPSLAALEGTSPPTKAMLVRVLGRWAYPQALPYLKQLADSTADAKLRSDCQAAISKIAALNPRYAPDTPAARMFYDLAQRYYQQDSALAPDPRTERPNLWYWHESQGLVYVPVPKDIYFELMTMRCARGALNLDKDMAAAVGLWLSANFRREAKLPPGDNDPVHGEDFPTGVYFARCAGPQYNLMVLAGALKANEPVVALGAIRALRSTAGPASLLGFADNRQPLIDALNFTNQTININAALALGQSLRGKRFGSCANVVPALAAGLAKSGRVVGAVVDPDQDNGNRVAGILKTAGYEVISGTDVDAVYQLLVDNAAALEAVILASDLSRPAADAVLDRLGKNSVLSRVPTLILTKLGQTARSEQLKKAHPRIGLIFSDANSDQILGKLEHLQRLAGRVTLSEQQAFGQALDAAATLYRIGLHGSDRYDIDRVRNELIEGLGSTQDQLQLACAEALTVIGIPEAQSALARYASDVALDKVLRNQAYRYLADSAKRYGNMLSDQLVKAIIDVSLNEQDLELRTAASQALGALNLKSAKASKVITQLDNS